jgi:hypothetical protein
MASYTRVSDTFLALVRLSLSEGERIKVRGFWHKLGETRNPHPALSLEKGEARLATFFVVSNIHRSSNV